jgi:hypothetical protein
MKRQPEKSLSYAEREVFKPIFDTWLSGLPILFLCAKDLCRFAANGA